MTGRAVFWGLCACTLMGVSLWTGEPVTWYEMATIRLLWSHEAEKGSAHK